MTDRLDGLERLQRLRAQGAIDDAEFAREKARLIADDRAGDPIPPTFRVLPVVIALVVVTAIVAIAWSLWPTTRTPDESPSPAPSAVASTVPTPTVPAGDRLAAAVKAAFPRGTVIQGEGGERYTVSSSKLVDAPFGPVLVSEGQAQDAAHASAGRLDVTYLRAEGGGFAVAKAYPKAIEIGSFGRMSEWSIGDAFADVPTIVAEGGFSGQGYSCSAAILAELRATGPAKVAQVPLSYDNSGTAVEGTPAVTIEGKIADIERGRSFDVRYTGSKTFTDHWVRRGDGYVRAGPTQLPEC